MAYDFDVTVIGASLAGSALALQLGRRAVRVALLDQKVPGQRRACGEGLSGRGVELLHKLGLETELSSLPSWKFSGFKLWRMSDSSALSLPLEASHPQPALGIERAVLDQFLFRQAAALRTVTFRVPARATGITRTFDHYLIKVGESTFSTRHVVLACGAESLLLRSLGPQSSPPYWRAGWSVHLDGEFRKPTSEVHILLQKGSEVYCTRVGPHRLNLAVLASKPPMVSPQPENLAEILKGIRKTIGFAGEPIDVVAGRGSLASIRRQPSHEGMIAIGDCCEQFDPLGGMGMTHALLSASLAASALLSVTEGSRSMEDAVAWYAMERERAARPLRRYTSITRIALQRLARTPLWDLCRSPRFTPITSPLLNSLLSLPT